MMMLPAAALGAGARPVAEEVAIDWVRFHEANFALVWRLLVRFGAPSAELEDLTQEVFTVVVRKLPGFRGDASIGTWLFSICRKVAAGARRRARLRQVATALFGRERSPAAIAPQPGVHADLERLLGRLGEDQRLTLLLHEVDGMSTREIAALYGCPEATVWSRLRAAWSNLERMRARP